MATQNYIFYYIKTFLEDSMYESFSNPYETNMNAKCISKNLAHIY